MNALELRDWLDLLEMDGIDLRDLPILFIENNQGLQTLPQYVSHIKNVKKFNNEQDLQLITSFDQALLIGPIVEIND